MNFSPGSMPQEYMRRAAPPLSLTRRNIAVTLTTQLQSPSQEVP